MNDVEKLNLALELLGEVAFHSGSEYDPFTEYCSFCGRVRKKYVCLHTLDCKYALLVGAPRVEVAYEGWRPFGPPTLEEHLREKEREGKPPIEAEMNATLKEIFSKENLP